MKQQIYNLLCKYYEKIYQKVLKRGDFVFIPTKREKVQISNFVDFLDEEIGINSIGEDWIFNYTIYIFKQRKEQKTRYKNHIPVNWIYGKKSYELYQKRHEKWVYFNDKFISEYNIRKPNLEEQMELNTEEYYEKLRKQYYDQEFPLSWCFNTVVYNKKSKYCLRCKSKMDCKILNK